MTDKNAKAGARALSIDSADLQLAFPGMGGFSAVNVLRMRTFHLAYRTLQSHLVPNSSQAVTNLKSPNLAQAARDLADEQPPFPISEIPWGQNLVLLFKLKDRSERLWYAAKTLEHGWSRAILTVQIESDLYGRQGKVVSNFAATLPAPQSDLAQQVLKDPYLFDFLTLHDDAIERDLENGLVDHIRYLKSINLPERNTNATSPPAKAIEMTVYSPRSTSKLRMRTCDQLTQSTMTTVL